MLKNQNPTQTKSWQKLQEHFKENKAFSLKKIFQKNKNRKESLSFSFQDFKVDYSKNLITQKTLDLLINLASACNLKDAIRKQFSGNLINTTENRAVLHTALRDFSTKKIIVEGKNIVLEIKNTLTKIEDFSNKVISGKLTGYTNKTFTDIVNIGVGGSDLGPKMVVESLQYYKNHLKTHFISNIDGDHVQEILKKINPETTLFVIVSKTFTTQETLTNANTIKKWFLAQKIGTKKEVIKHHFVAVSTNLEAVVDFGIAKDHIFTMWNWVGGRFSLWSAVGLTIALSLGFTNFKQLLKGANAMDLHFKETDFAKNIPVLSALISIWYNNFYKTETEAVLPYSQYLEKFVPFLQQLMMESNGKSVDRNAAKVTYETGNIIWGGTGTNMQHTFMQLVHQGTKMIPVELIGFENSLYDNKEHHKKLLAHFYAQAEALAYGKSKEKAHLELKIKGDLNKINTLLAFKVFEGNKPSTTMTIKKLTPKNLGSLIAFYEQKTFVQGIIWNINSFDQFGVELGKELATTNLQ
ncbi:MAG: glucose-6-phosphate isomerase [Flavobacteriaceae bacterium]|nr:glucose-6-phosphate isomerase [Flavobacteriaceae bacterium]